MKIALIGYGKMGKEIEKIALSRGHEIVSIIDINNREDFASEAFRSADVAIEFTAPSVAYGNCLEAFKNGVKVVSGSTGWMGEHGEEMRRLCQGYLCGGEQVPGKDYEPVPELRCVNGRNTPRAQAGCPEWYSHYAG